VSEYIIHVQLECHSHRKMLENTGQKTNQKQTLLKLSSNVIKKTISMQLCDCKL